MARREERLDPVGARRRPGSRQAGLAGAVVALLGLAAGCGGGPEAGDGPLRWYVFREPSGAFAAAARACSEESGGRFAIEIEALPASADQQREQLARRLAARDPDVDLLGMDVIWTAEFARAGWILPWEGELARQVRRGTLGSAVESASFRGALYAAPFTTNTQLLWYRTDLVDEPPATWDALVDTAERLAARGQPHAVQLQGARYEGLTVWFCSLLASAGGAVLDAAGESAALPEGPTREALRIMRRLAASPTAPPALATAREDEARLGFESGRSAFMLNYTFVWPSARANVPELFRRMGSARWPRVAPERPSRVTLGGLNLAVGAFSRHPALAFEAAACLQRDVHQVAAARDGGLLPTREALYDHPEVRAAFPFADLLRETLRDATQRPRTPAYTDVSLAIQRTLHPPRDIDPETDARRLRDAVEAALHSRGLL